MCVCCCDQVTFNDFLRGKSQVRDAKKIEKQGIIKESDSKEGINCASFRGCLTLELLYIFCECVIFPVYFKIGKCKKAVTFL